jgi:hypothetical protein
MKTKITLFIGCLAAGILSSPGIQAMNYWQDTLAVDSITEEQEIVVVVNQDSLPTEIQHKEVTKHGDTTFINFGNKKIRIIEQDGETLVKIQNRSENEGDEEFKEDEEIVDECFKGKHEGKDLKEKSWKDFKGHWAGFEFGLNNYVDKDFSFNRTPENEFMDISTGRSWNINLNFAQYSVGLGTDHLGLVTGMGLEWSNYHFSSDTNSIQKLNGEITWRPIPENITKNRLQTTYLTIPILLEAQFFGKDRDDRFYLAGGIIGGLKLFSNTKLKYVENGEKQKEKVKDDYYISPLRYGLTARAGYKAIKLYVNYYPVPLFLEDRGPELYPIAAGLVVSF